MHDLNRAERRMTMKAKPLPATALKISNYGGAVLVGIEVPGYVRLTPVEAIELANSLLQIAGEFDSKDTDHHG